MNSDENKVDGSARCMLPEQRPFRIMLSQLEAFNAEVASLIGRVLPSTVTVSGYSSDLSEDSQGSGWIYTPNIVVTNHHVVENIADPVSVQPVGGEALEGKVLGCDPSNDIAIISVADLNGKPLDIETKTPSLGELSIAVGSPHSFRESASFGIISGLSRQIRKEGGHALEEMIQTDASVNPGNSGGPLVNIYGRLIGMNTMGPSETVNLAVPAETIAHVVPELIAHGEIARGSLGISITADQEIADGRVTQIIRVRTVRNESSGLMKGDIISAINGKKINRRIDVMRSLGRESIGKEIDIVIIREGREKTIKELVAKRS